MEIDQYLNPDDIKCQCEEARLKLEQDNEVLANTASAISSFSNDDEISSEAYDALKLQLSDYRDVISGMITANNIDIADFETLSRSVGDEVLDGSKIIPEMVKALQEIELFKNMYIFYDSLAASEPFAPLRFSYQSMSWSYKGLFELEQRIFKRLDVKAKCYDAIEESTAGLFTNSNAIREYVREGLACLGRAFRGGHFQPEIALSWREDLVESVNNALSNQSTTIYEKILEVRGYTEKDIDSLSDEELAEIFCEVISEISDLLPAVKVGGKYTLQVTPEITLEYSVAVKNTDSPIELDYLIEEEKLEFKKISLVIKIGEMVKLKLLDDKEGASFGTSDDHGDKMPGISDEGQVTLSTSLKSGNNTYKIKVCSGISKFSLEESVEEKISEDSGTIISKIKITKEGTKDMTPIKEQNTDEDGEIIEDAHHLSFSTEDLQKIFEHSYWESYGGIYGYLKALWYLSMGM